ncbi:MAG: hypothetical protein IJG55_06010 [Synergistaceae bacterium]|nr:hypothetical protein [Synergistaceae bacterium]
MERKSIEKYLGRKVEITLMPDGHKSEGVLLKCEDDHIEIGQELWVYQMIWGIRPLDDEPVHAEAPKPEPVPVPEPELKPEFESLPEPVQVSEPEPESEAENAKVIREITFQSELDECIHDMQKAMTENESLSADYVRKFRTGKPDKIQNAAEKILSQYQYAVKINENKPYSMRMIDILNSSRQLWKTNQNNIIASEIYAFFLYITGENTKSVNIYTRIHDFRAALMASSSAASRMNALACLIVSEPLNPKNFALLLKSEPQQLIAMLIWILENAAENQNNSHEYREMCFVYTASIANHVLGFSSWDNHESLCSQENIDALKQWLMTQKYDTKIMEHAYKTVGSPAVIENASAENVPDIGARKFDGEIDYFNPNRDKLYGFIKCNAVMKYDVPLSSEGAIFFHLNQIEDKDLRRRLITCKKMRPKFKVTFKLGNNGRGAAAYEIHSRGLESSRVFTADVFSALSEEGVIEFYARHNTPPFGKVRTKDKTLCTFNEYNVKDPLLAVFLEYSPNVEGHPVRFIRGTNMSGNMQIQNIVSAVPFPESKVQAWEREGLIQKAKDRIKFTSHSEDDTDDFESNPELEELVNRSYTPLEPYVIDANPDSESEAIQKKSSILDERSVDTFKELPKFLQDKILNTSAAMSETSKILTDNFYSKGHYTEVRNNYLYLVSKFNTDNLSLTNSERAERCFVMARYVYNFFSLADDEDIKLYSPSEEDNIRIMAYKGLEYLLYSELDGTRKDTSRYDTARRYCLLKITDEIKEAGRIGENNAWLRIYIYSYFINGLRHDSRSGKWTAQGISLSGSSLLECNDFSKFFDGLLTLAYVTGAKLLNSTLKGLLYNLEYSGELLNILGLDGKIYQTGNADNEIQLCFQNALDQYEKREDISIQDPEVIFSPGLLKILDVQAAIVRLMKKELPVIFGTSENNLDDVLRVKNPILNSDEYKNSLVKTRRKYNTNAGLLDVLPINVLGSVMGQYWANSFGKYFGDKPYDSYWKEKFSRLQHVRDSVFHAHPEYLSREDIESVKAICLEITECLGLRK